MYIRIYVFQRLSGCYAFVVTAARSPKRSYRFVVVLNSSISPTGYYPPSRLYYVLLCNCNCYCSLESYSLKKLPSNATALAGLAAWLPPCSKNYCYETYEVLTLAFVKYPYLLHNLWVCR